MRFPTPGEQFAGRYQIEAIIGQGGFSRVYLATQPELGRKVAIKVLKPTKAEEETDALRLEKISTRFQQEARLISRLKDRSTVMMHDYGATDDGLLYMILEYVDGTTLRSLCKTGPLEAGRAVHLLRQILSSLQEAHTLGVLHRDIKPSNIMVYEHAGRRDLVKVLDFGIAKAVEAKTELEPITLMTDVTGDGMLVGTPRYMSPEQIRGDALGPPSDIYSIGLVAYELLIGTKAIDSDSSMSIIARHLDPTPISIAPDADVPARLRQIVNGMLRKDAKHRYQSCGEILESLKDWDQGPALEEWEEDPTVPGVPATLADLDDEQEPPLESDDSEGVDKRLLFVALLVVGFGLSGTLYFWQSDDTAETTAAAATDESESESDPSNRTDRAKSEIDPSISIASRTASSFIESARLLAQTDQRIAGRKLSDAADVTKKARQVELEKAERRAEAARKRAAEKRAARKRAAERARKERDQRKSSEKSSKSEEDGLGIFGIE